MGKGGGEEDKACIITNFSFSLLLFFSFSYLFIIIDSVTYFFQHCTTLVALDWVGACTKRIFPQVCCKETGDGVTRRDVGEVDEGRRRRKYEKRQREKRRG